MRIEFIIIIIYLLFYSISMQLGKELKTTDESVTGEDYLLTGYLGMLSGHTSIV